MNITCPIVCHIKFINGTMDFPSDNNEKKTQWLMKSNYTFTFNKKDEQESVLD